MGQPLFANNAYTSVATTANAGDATITVLSSALFPAVTTASGNWFYACLQDTFANLEIVKVTNITGVVWTVTRAVGGTSARTWAVGAIVELRITAEGLADVTAFSLTTAVQNSTPQYLTAVSGTNAISGTLPAPFSGYAAGQKFHFVAAGANTGAATLNVNGAGAKALTKQGASALVGGELVAGTAYVAVYDGTQFQLIGVGFAANGANTDITSLSSLASVNSGQLAGLRNKLINGGMQVMQRGNVAVSGNVTRLFGGADRWALTTSGWASLTGTLQQAGAIGGSASSTGLVQYVSSLVGTASTTNSGVLIFDQRIEGANTAGLRSKTITVTGAGFGAAGASGSLVQKIGLYRPPSTLDTFTTTPTLIAESTAFPFTYALNATDAANGLEVRFTISGVNSISAGAFSLADVQLELGSVATPFEQRPYGMELALCQRYYEVITGPYSGYAAAVNNARASVKFCASKRITPVLDKVVTGTGFVNNAGGNPAITGYTLQYATPQGTAIDFAVASGLTLGQGVVVSCSDLVSLTAEL